MTNKRKNELAEELSTGLWRNAFTMRFIDPWPCVQRT